MRSVFAQTYSRIELLIIDSGSEDNTVALAQESIKNTNPRFPVRFIRLEKNLGFAAGHNLGIRESQGEFVLLLNQDVVLSSDFLKNAQKFFQESKNGKVASLQAKTRRIGRDLLPIDIIDSTGFQIFKNRRIINRGQGEVDKGQYEKEEEIFGADGAVPVFRRQALEDAKIEISGRVEYLDENFFSYKEDIDLAWRLRLLGWKSFYLPRMQAWHARGSGESAAKNYFSIIQERLKLSQFSKYLSFRNQRLMQIKNEIAWSLLKSFRFIFKEIASWIYVLLFERFTRKAFGDLKRMAPLAWEKRKQIMAKKRVSSAEIERWLI